MAPSYKLTYFDGQGLAEAIRFLFSYGGIEFEDSRFSFEEWPQIKKTLPFGRVPLLELDGKVAGQSAAICRYVAKQVKLVGNDDWEDAEIDAVVDTIVDLRLKMMAYHFEQDAAVKEVRKEQLFKEHLPFYLQRLEGIAKANNGYLALGRLTWADLYFVAPQNYFNKRCGVADILADYPTLTALKKRVLDIPNIKAWVAKRPQNDL